MIFMNGKRVKKLEAAISQTESKIGKQLNHIREYVNTHDINEILNFLPYELSVLHDSNDELKKLKLCLKITKIFCDDEEV